jgi:hypothetical protein
MEKCGDQRAGEPFKSTRHHVRVMLHLRSLYVSKAAILTISMPQASVENRSPA